MLEVGALAANSVAGDSWDAQHSDLLSKLETVFFSNLFRWAASRLGREHLPAGDSAGGVGFSSLGGVGTGLEAASLTDEAKCRVLVVDTSGKSSWKT